MCKQVKGHHLQLAFGAAGGHGELSTEFQPVISGRKRETLNSPSLKGIIPGFVGFVAVKHASSFLQLFSFSDMHVIKLL